MENNSSQVTVCAACGAIYDVAKDGRFLLLNPPVDKDRHPLLPPEYTTEAEPLHFCGTDCLVKFVSQPDNRSRIAWFEPAALSSEPEALAKCNENWRARHGDKTVNDLSAAEMRTPETEEMLTAFQLHHAWKNVQEGRLPCGHCGHGGDEYLLRSRCEQKNGPFLCTNKGWFCNGTSCLVAACAKKPYDAKGYWEREGCRCAHCNDIFRTDMPNGGWGGLVLNASKGVDGFGTFTLPRHSPQDLEMLFCCPACLLAHLEEHPETKLFWVPSVQPEAGEHANHADCEETGCGQCEKSGRQYVAVYAPYGSIWDSLNGPNYFCSVVCLIEAFRRDAAQSKEWGLGKWYAKRDATE